MTLDADDTWTKMKTCINRITKDILEESCGIFVVNKDTRCWNKEISIYSTSFAKQTRYPVTREKVL